MDDVAYPWRTAGIGVPEADGENFPLRVRIGYSIAIPDMLVGRQKIFDVGVLSSLRSQPRPVVDEEAP